jgi:proteasome lid subunit RPN8/RPN11
MNDRDRPILELKQDHWRTMLEHILRNLPEEACGFVAGTPLQRRLGWTSQAVLPITNMLHSPVRFHLEPQEHLAAFERMDRQGWELAAIFHSHPTGPDHPSATDIAESHYPGTIYLIWSPEPGSWTCKAYLIQDQSFQQVEIELNEAR